MQVILSEEQQRWLKRWFPVTENDRLASAMGISVGCMRGLAQRLGVAKSEEGLSAIRKRQGRAMAQTFESRGLYDKKRGHPCSEATQEGSRRRWELIRQGVLKSPTAIMKERNPEQYREMLASISRSRKEMFRKEKMRMIYGLEKKTRLKHVVLCPFTRSQIHHRHNAIARGYLLDADCSEGTPDRYTIFYDDETERSTKFEENCIKDGFTIKKDE